MDENIVINYVQMAVILTTTSLLVWYRLKRKIITLLWFIAINLLLLLRGIFYHFSQIRDRDLIFDNSDSVLLFFAIIIAYYYFEVTLRERPGPLRILFTSALLGSFITLLIREPNKPPVETGFLRTEANALWVFPLELYAIFSFSVAIYVGFRMIQYPSNRQAKRIGAVLIALGLIFLTGVALEFTEFFIDRDFDVTIALMPGYLIYTILLLRYPYISYVSPNPIYRIIVLMRDGDTYQEITASSTKPSSTLNLAEISISMGTMFSELLTSHQNQRPLLIDTKMTDIAILFHNTKNFVAILEVQKSSLTLKWALQSMVRDLEDYVLVEEKDITKKADELIVRYFPLYSLTTT